MPSDEVDAYYAALACSHCSSCRRQRQWMMNKNKGRYAGLVSVSIGMLPATLCC